MDTKNKLMQIVTNVNKTDIFLEYNWLIKHNLEVNWNMGTIVYKMSKKLQNITLGYIIQKLKNTTNI